MTLSYSSLRATHFPACTPGIVLAVMLLTATVGAAAGATGKSAGIGVADFDHEGYGADGIAASARGVVEHELSRFPQVTVVERSRLGDVLDEVGFQQSGVTRPDGAADIGVAHNVQYLLFGQAARQARGDYRLALRVVQVATGRVLRTEEILLSSDAARFERDVRAGTRRLLTLALASLPVQQVLLPAAVISMGSDRYREERPVHKVHVGAFLLDRTEVTRGAFAVWRESQAAAAPSKSADPDLAGPVLAGPDLPVTGVSWQDAASYCGALGKRLPTEAEFERAARGPAGRTFPWGESAPTLGLARFASAAPVSVTSLSAGASPEGLLHLSGNAAEWVADWYGPYSVPDSATGAGAITDPTGPTDGDYKVVRGGGFSSSADELRGAARGFHNALRGGGHIGFRCAAAVQQR